LNPGIVETFSYPVDFLSALLTFGLAPRETTSPAVVRGALNDLYRFELRRMRDRLRAGQIAAADYHGLVVALRKRYWPLSLTLDAWQRICDPAEAHKFR
jgi:hypothetical protein